MPRGSYVVVKKFGYGNYSTYGIQFIRKAITALIVRGDVVVFEFPPDRKISYVKRVIGLPEDHIEYKNKRVYLNGAAVTTSSIHKNSPLEILQEKTYQIAIDCSRASQDFDIRVKLGHLFVLGDNRDNSNDSRQWGQVPYDHVIGKVVLTLAPSDETPFALGWQRSAGCEEK